MKNKLLITILTVLMLFGALCLVSFAETVISDGNIDENGDIIEDLPDFGI